MAQGKDNDIIAAEDGAMIQNKDDVIEGNAMAQDKNDDVEGGVIVQSKDDNVVAAGGGAMAQDNIRKFKTLQFCAVLQSGVLRRSANLLAASDGKFGRVLRRNLEKLSSAQNSTTIFP